MPNKVSSLYIHIPFCRSKCAYCDFFSVTEDADSSYLKALSNEISYYADYYGVDEWQTVYIGGGTPSLLKPEHIDFLMNAVKKSSRNGIDAGAEVTIEANPADITEEFLDTLIKNGINRLSLGVQCLDGGVLRTLGRRADAECTEKALQLIKEKWLAEKRRFSVDFISGLPGLSDSEFIRGMEKTLSYGPDHVSLYSLMLEEGTPLFSAVESGKVPYSEEASDRQWFAGRDLLKRNGFAQYEVSNFAKPGYESRHNTVYWHLDDYIGCGAGACGTVSAGGSALASDFASGRNSASAGASSLAAGSGDSALMGGSQSAGDSADAGALEDCSSLAGCSALVGDSSMAGDSALAGGSKSADGTALAGGSSLAAAKRWNNNPDVKAYVDYWLNTGGEAGRQDAGERGVRGRNEAEWPCTVVFLDAETRQFEFLMMGLRLREGVSSAEFKRRFPECGKSLEEIIGYKDGLFRKWMTDGLAAELFPQRYALTEDGIMLLNRFLEELEL